MGGNPKSDLRILDLTSHRVTAVPGSVGTFSPRWSPDGQSIVALSSDFLNLMLFDVASERWSKLPQKSAVTFPEWSRDSQFIYFLQGVDDSGVFRMHRKGGAAERIVDLNGFHATGAVGYWLGLDLTDSPILLRNVETTDIYALHLE
jgi:dipeptidyl aminopeptidase/acylaminoacyl peptidase